MKVFKSHKHIICNWLTNYKWDFAGQSDSWWIHLNIKLQKNKQKILSLRKCMLSCFSHVWLFAIPWTVANQAPLSMGILQARILKWVAMPSSRGSSPPRDWTHVSCRSCIAGRFFTAELPGKPMLWPRGTQITSTHSPLAGTNHMALLKVRGSTWLFHEHVFASPF